MVVVVNRLQVDNMLPQGTEPLILHDGTKISPIDGAIVRDEVFVEVPNTRELQQNFVTAQIKIADLPLPPKKMNVLSVILSYSLQGIANYEIASIVNVEEERIAIIKDSPEYKELQATIITNITKADLADVRTLFVENSRSAANVMFDVINDPEMGTTNKMIAAKDVLDRAGQRPVDVVEHRHKLEGGLTIEYVQRKDNLPAIDITPEEF